MDGTPNIAKVGVLLGDNTRASMLNALMHGKALTAKELAEVAGITAQTATFHLSKLRDGKLVIEQKQGRHKYFSLTNEKVAMLLETLMGLTAENEPLKIKTGPKDQSLCYARVCYNHLAGTKGIELYNALITNRHLTNRNGSLVLSRKGGIFMQDFGINMNELKKSRAPLCRTCLDWSERRSHLAGSLGRALLVRFEELNWLTRVKDSRVIKFRPKGEKAFNELFGSD